METQSSITEQIRRCNDAFEAAFARQDSAAMARLYTEEAVLLPPGADTQKGPTAIQNFWQGAMQLGVAKATLTTAEAEDLGDTVIEVGHYTLYSAADDLLDQGKYLVVWKRQKGQWFLHQDIWNTSQSAG